MRFRNLIDVCQGKALQIAEDRPIQTLLIDSRKAVVSEGSVFFALKGDRHDGHKFLKDLYHLGLRQFVVENEIVPASFPGANILKVSSSLSALQAVAAYHRSAFHIPVIGITGSNGKTIVKEWLSQMLFPNLKIAKNPGSYNSQVGVPLSVWQLNDQHELGIFEAGISKPGEMEKLEVLIQPTIGLFTNLGTAHDEGFSSLTEKVTEKAKLFSNCERVIYCKDQISVDEALGNKNNTLTWGQHPQSDIRITPLNVADFTITFDNSSFTLHLPFQDMASQQNAFHVIAVMLFRGYAPSIIQERISALHSVPMRLELKQGINRCLLIDDSYNNDLAGLQISLDYLKSQQKTKKTLILSDILQSGLSNQDLVLKIKTLVTTCGVNRIIGIGPVLQAAASSFPGNTFFPSTSAFLESITPGSFSDEAILIKGARNFQFEKIILHLQRKVHGTVIEIDLNALVHNLNYFKSLLGPGTKIMAMVKAFAYGSGSEEVANLLQYHRVDYLGVAYADEGIELRKNNISLPIMVMNPTVESFEFLLEFQLEPEMYSLRILQSFAEFLDGRKAVVHIKADTGMHRLGIEESEFDEALGILRAHNNIRVGSVFSHLSGADEKEHDDFSQQQARTFTRIANQLEESLGYRPIRHLLNSPGILRLPQYQFDMVRLGIGLYGVDPTEVGSTSLKPVAILKTIISQIKKIKAGETIGYGRKGKAITNMTLATLAIGYADGFSRNFSNGKGKVLIRGQFAPVIGNICMDMTMVDVTGIDVQEDDEVIIFGAGLPIGTVAGWINTIPYELLTSMSERVKRVFYAESI